jgi:hypothetical protein
LEPWFNKNRKIDLLAGWGIKMKILKENKNRKIISAVVGALLIVAVLFFALPGGTNTAQVQACGYYCNPEPPHNCWCDWGNWWGNWWDNWFGGNNNNDWCRH